MQFMQNNAGIMHNRRPAAVCSSQSRLHQFEKDRRPDRVPNWQSRGQMGLKGKYHTDVHNPPGREGL